MLIEGAERFGLRSGTNSWPGGRGIQGSESGSYKRTIHQAAVEAMEENRDRLSLVEIDLERRGPGASSAPARAAAISSAHWPTHGCARCQYRGACHLND